MPNSLDDRLLKSVLAQALGLAVQIAPAGGKRNLPAVRAFLESRAPDTVALAIQDRDHTPAAEVEAGWQDPSARSLSWRCHEVENHLLTPWVLQSTFDDYRATVAAPWVAHLPLDEAAIEALLAALAPRLFNDHIGREVCAALRRRNAALGSVMLNVPAGIDPVAGTALQWRQEIDAEIARLNAVCVAVIADPALQPAAVAATWATIEAQVRDPTFLTSGRHLRDIKGKRLLDLLWNHLRGVGYTGTKADFEANLVAGVRRAYGPTKVLPDFEDLAARVRILLGP